MATGSNLGHLIGNNEALLIGLVESKTEVILRKDVGRLVGTGWDFFHHPSSSKLGGLMFLQRKDMVNVVVFLATTQFLIGPMDLGIPRCTIMLFYANKDPDVQHELFNEVANSLHPGVPVVVWVHFNCFLAHNEKEGGKKFMFSMAI